MNLKSKIIIGMATLALGAVSMSFGVEAKKGSFFDLVKASAVSCACDGMEMFEAIREEKSYEEVTALIDRMQNLALTGSNGETVLHEAALLGRLDIVKYLVEKCHMVLELKDIFGETALHKAALLGRLDVVKYFIEKCHMDPNLKTSTGETALHKAAVTGKLDVVKYLVEDCHVDLSFMSKSLDTPLHCATWGRAYAVMEYLISKEANMVHCINKNGDTPANLTLGFLDVKYRSLLMKHGASLDLSRRQSATPRE